MDNASRNALGDYELIEHQVLTLVQELLPQGQPPSPEIVERYERLLRSVRVALGLPAEG